MTVMLGKAPRHSDPRTLQYRAVRSGVVWTPPPRYSWFEENAGAVATPMFANDQHGCCVISGRAHHTLRFEHDETGTAPAITDTEVKAEYFTESGGQDHGLVLLYSLRDWRNKGWTAGGKHYRIHSFAEVQPQDHDLVREAMVVGAGIQLGVNLPLSAADQLNAGAPWDLSSGPRSAAGSWGGHLVHADEYDEAGIVCETWGKRQRLSWRWLDAYCDEAYLVVDDINHFGPDDIDHAALAAALEDL